MEVWYILPLSFAESQAYFSEFKIHLNVVVKNAEAISALTDGKVWWEEDEFHVAHLVSDYENDELQKKIEDALAQRARALAISERRTDVTIDAREALRTLFPQEQ